VISGRERLTGHITVPLPPAQAYPLFTPRGEQAWARGWHPSFPAAAPDDTDPGTVFETHAHGQPTIWLVTGREPGRRICYARVTPGDLAGTVTVTITPSGAHSDVEVTYELTALTDAAEGRLRDFAAGYPAYLSSWQAAIGTGVPGPQPHPSPAAPQPRSHPAHLAHLAHPAHPAPPGMNGPSSCL
jgi:hypothetical protein